MYTGIQKKAVVFKPGTSSLIEEAYFILKDDYSTIKESEMIKEANKILKNNIVGSYFFESDKKAPPPSKKNGVIGFLSGSLISFVLCTVLFLLIK